jgi:hypothetical protein
MKSQIVNANALTGAILVDYTTDDGQHLSTQTLDVPIENGNFITGAKLEHFILISGPYALEKRILAVKAVSNFNDIQALVEAP